MLNIVLYQPRIPHNTGNIGRLSLALNARLHLIYPLGFILDDKNLKRAGMDYFKEVDLVQWDSFEVFLEANPIKNNHFLFTTKAQKDYFQAHFCEESYLYFGREDKGLPKDLINAHIFQCFKIPMFNNARSLNLSNAVSIVAYEAIRQTKFC